MLIKSEPAFSLAGASTRAHALLFQISIEIFFDDRDRVEVVLGQRETKVVYQSRCPLLNVAKRDVRRRMRVRFFGETDDAPRRFRVVNAERNGVANTKGRHSAGQRGVDDERIRVAGL